MYSHSISSQQTPLKCYTLAFNFTFIMAGSSYLYSRNTWCAIFSINPRQTLKQQANKSVDFIWHPLWTPPVFWGFFLFFFSTHILSFFANSSLWAPDTSAALQKINILIVFCNAHQDHCPRSSSEKYFIFFFFHFISASAFDNKIQIEKNTKTMPYFVSLVSRLSRWSLRPLLTLEMTEKGSE